MARVSTAELHPYVGEGKIELIVEDDHVARCHVKELGRGLHAAPGLVHEGFGPEKYALASGKRALGEFTLELLLPARHLARLLHEIVEREPSQVVARRRVLAAPVTKPHHQHELSKAGAHRDASRAGVLTLFLLVL